MTSQNNYPPESVSVLPLHQTNQQWWDEVTPVHLRSEFYDVASFLKGECRLDALELTGLGDMEGKSVLHLQCHFGLSTIELVRQGAARAVGVDFSPIAIKAARELAAQTGTANRVSFICCDVLELERHLDKRFDIVFASYGVLTWISDLSRWAKVAARCLKPEGRFFLIELHPALSMFDWKDGEIRRLFDYFHNPEGYVCSGDADYADNSFLPKKEAIEWQWSLSDIFRAITEAGLTIDKFDEYSFCCCASFPNMVRRGKFFYLPEGEKQIPMLFSIVANTMSTQIHEK